MKFFEKIAYLKKEDDGKWHVYSEAGRHFGKYNTETEARKRLAQMEYFKKVKK